MINDSYEQIGSPARALLVDDEPSMRAALVRLLTLPGFEVGAAGSGAEAIIHFGQGRWDVVLTNLMMPGMRGDQLAAALRNRVHIHG